MEIPVEVLRYEHAMTRRMIGVLLALAGRLVRGGVFSAGDTAIVLRYFREFVEIVHHGKEARILYPCAAMIGDERAGSAAGELVADHEESKLLLHSLTVFWEPDELRADERRAFAELARIYATRLERHMETEERWLFPIAELIPGDDRLRLLDDFEHAIACESGHAVWLAEIERLEQVYIGAS